MELRSELAFREAAGFEPIFSNNDWNLQFAGDQERFVAESLRSSARLDE